MKTKTLIFVIALLVAHASADVSIFDEKRPSNSYTSAQELVDTSVYNENATYSKFYTSAALAYCDKTGHLSDPKDCCSASSWLDYIGFTEMYIGRQDMKEGEEVTYAIASNPYDTKTRPYRHFLVSWAFDKTSSQDWIDVERILINYELVDYDLYDVVEGTKIVEFFNRLYKRVRGKFFEDLESMMPYRKENFDITFIGHSLGGAFAELAAFEFKERYPHHTANLVTFGSPRVGNFKFSSELALK